MMRLISRGLALCLLLSGGALAADKPAASNQAGSGEVHWFRNQDAQRKLPAAVAGIVADAMALMNKSQWAQASEKFDAALKLAPNEASIYNNRGLSHQMLGMLDAAIADYSKALALDPAVGPIAYENRGYCYKAQGKLDLAVADFTQALTLAPRLEQHLLLERGRLLVDLGDGKSAERDFNQAREIPATRAQAYSELAYLAMNRQDFPACIAQATKAIQANGSFADGWVNRGACEIAMAKYQKAASDLSAAIRLKPGMAEAYLSRSAAYVAMGNCRAAQDDAHTAARLAPARADMARQVVARCGPAKRERGGAI